MMQIVNDLGPVQHAWLDGAEIDPSCSGMRFRLLVGDAGGIVCDIVVGPPGLDIAKVEQMATHAVVNTDPLEDPLPITDGNGRPARILADPIHVQPVSSIVRIGEKAQHREPIEAHAVNPLGAMALGLGFFLVLLGFASGVAVMIGGGLILMRKVKVLPALTQAYNVAVDRERERRERMPEAVTVA